MNNKSNFSNFDYSTIEGIPENFLRTELLEKRLMEITRKGDEKILEVGIGNGDVTIMLAKKFNNITCVDSDKENCEKVRNRLYEKNIRNVNIIISKIEDAELSENFFNNVVLLNILEHLENPVNVLEKIIGKICIGGTVHITVPLADSLHRMLGVSMGMISKPDDITESDISFGHYRVYTLDLLYKHLDIPNLKIFYEQTFYLKPLPTSILTPLSMEIHRGLFKLGQTLSQFASYVYVEAVRSA